MVIFRDIDNKLGFNIITVFMFALDWVPGHPCYVYMLVVLQIFLRLRVNWADKI